MPGLERLSAAELLAGYRSGELTPPEVVEAVADAIEARDPALGAFTTLCLDRARAEAAAAAERYGRGDPAGPLDGVPLAVKDLFDTAGVRTTYGSRMFAAHVPDRDAEAVRRARAAGAIVVGKTQTHEFAWGITSINRAMGTSRNPWDRSRVPGGSSGGSAVALAADLVPLAFGSDTGGSIRIPSAFCGTVGLKPSYGRVSTAGVFPLARSLDHAGPMARTPADAALLLAVVAGADDADPATAQAPSAPPPAAAEGSLAGLRIGVGPDLRPVALEPDVETTLSRTAGRLGDLGAALVEVSLPEAAAAGETYSVIQRAEALFTHRRAGLYPARADEYGDDVRRHLDRSGEVTLDDFLAAGAERERLRAGFGRVFGEVDLLLSPVSACSPFRIDEETRVLGGEPRTLRELVLPFTVAQDLAGLPACALRAGFDRAGCPVGVQLTGPVWGEAVVVAGAQALFAATEELQARRPASLPAAAPA